MSHRPPESSDPETLAAAMFAASVTASFAEVLDAFEEPAWLLSRSGAILFANQSARSLGPMPDEVAARARLTGRAPGPLGLGEAEPRDPKRPARRTRGARQESSARWRALRAISIDGGNASLVLVTARSADSMRPSSLPPPMPRGEAPHEPPTADSHADSHEAWGLPPSLAEVARLLVHGFSSREIAAATGYSLATVRVYSQRIYARLDVHSRLELVAWAQARGLA